MVWIFFGIARYKRLHRILHPLALRIPRSCLWYGMFLESPNIKNCRGFSGKLRSRRLILNHLGELGHLPFKIIIILFSFLEPCALHLDIFINELKQLPMLHDSACFVSQGEKEISTLLRLAMP